MWTVEAVTCLTYPMSAMLVRLTMPVGPESDEYWFHVVGSVFIGCCGHPCCLVGTLMMMSVPFGWNSDVERRGHDWILFFVAAVLVTLVAREVWLVICCG